jgi:glutaredoxin 3
MHDDAAAARAQELGVSSVPAVAIDGILVDCCTGRSVDEKALQAAGLGQPIA